MTSRLQKQLYGIAIYEEEILLQDFTGKAEKRLIVNPEQLMSFFHTGITLHTFPGLIWVKDDGLRREYLLTLPAGERTIFYRWRKKLLTRKLKLPSMAVKASIDAEGRVIAISISCFSGKLLKPESILYELPLPNIYGSGICLGGTERSHGDDVREAIEKILFDTPFNNHNDLCGKEKLSFRDYHKKYAGKCPFFTLNRIGYGRDVLNGGGR